MFCLRVFEAFYFRVCKYLIREVSYSMNFILLTKSWPRNKLSNIIKVSLKHVWITLEADQFRVNYHHWIIFKCPVSWFLPYEPYDLIWLTMKRLAWWVTSGDQVGVNLRDKCSWKGQLEKTRSWKVLSWKDPSEVGKNRAKLERTERGWKVSSEVGKFRWSWKVLAEVGNFKLTWKLLFPNTRIPNLTLGIPPLCV